MKEGGKPSFLSIGRGARGGAASALGYHLACVQVRSSTLPSPPTGYTPAGKGAPFPEVPVIPARYQPTQPVPSSFSGITDAYLQGDPIADAAEAALSALPEGQRRS